MTNTVQQGMGPEEIATLHYKFLMENNRKEWLKTFRKYHQNQADKYGSSPDFYWRTGRKYVDELGYTYEFKNKDEKQSDDKHVKLFFYRYNKEGEVQGAGPVPIHVVKDEDEGNEWRIDVATY